MAAVAVTVAPSPLEAPCRNLLRGDPGLRYSVAGGSQTFRSVELLAGGGGVAIWHFYAQEYHLLIRVILHDHPVPRETMIWIITLLHFTTLVLYSPFIL